MFEEKKHKSEEGRETGHALEPSLWQKILANISIDIEDVYIRVEDSNYQNK